MPCVHRLFCFPLPWTPPGLKGIVPFSRAQSALIREQVAVQLARSNVHLDTLHVVTQSVKNHLFFQKKKQCKSRCHVTAKSDKRRDTTSDNDLNNEGPWRCDDIMSEKSVSMATTHPTGALYMRGSNGARADRDDSQQTSAVTHAVELA